MKDVNEFLSNKGISLEKLEVDEPTSNLSYSVEEFDKVKTRVMKYVTYKKRTEKEVRDKFRDMFDETILSDVIEKIKELGYINEDDYVERSFNEFIALKTISVREIKYKLLAKGVSVNSIDNYIAEHYDELLDFELNCAKKIVKKKKDLDEFELKNYLYKKMYREDIIKKVL